MFAKLCKNRLDFQYLKVKGKIQLKRKQTLKAFRLPATSKMHPLNSLHQGKLVCITYPPTHTHTLTLK